MNYTLIGSLTSPYVRKIRLLLHGTPYELKVVNYLEEAGNEYLQSINPVNKLPVLIDGDKTIIDSRVIFNYLTKKNKWPELSIDEENILSTIDGAMDASINLFMLRRGGLDLNCGNGYVERNLARVSHILKHLTPWVKEIDEKNPAHWNFLTMSLYSYLFWLGFREANSLDAHPELTKFLERFKNALGVAETTIIA
ncbi:MAG: glutathione S-transferase family protein [Bacteriovorax sp.]|nr:glutathione S-transferase family protein [Bacteriovorax sp.]